MRTYYLRTLRERLDLTQNQLAARSRVAQNTISKLESNPHARPVFETVRLLAGALGVNAMQLRFGPDPATRRRALRLRARLSA